MLHVCDKLGQCSAWLQACAQVGYEVLRWEEGKVIAFDDTFIHQAWIGVEGPKLGQDIFVVRLRIADFGIPVGIIRGDETRGYRCSLAELNAYSSYRSLELNHSSCEQTAGTKLLLLTFLSRSIHV